MFSLTGLLGSSSRKRSGTTASSKSKSLVGGGASSSSSLSLPLRNRGPEVVSYLYSSQPASVSTEFISDESQLPPASPPLHHDTSLNDDLELLVTLFPDVQIEVFREMLTNFSDDSRLALVTDLLLRNPSEFVKGRRKAQDTDTPATRQLSIPQNEAFRSTEYKAAVKALALHEFKGLSRSSITAVLSEHNYSYLDARQTLVDLSSRSWKFAISSLLFRRKAVTTAEAETHPLIVWKSSGNGSIIPTIKSTGNSELDGELFRELVAPLKRNEQEAREQSDRALAHTLHTEEAEACDATYECGCCFTDATFEEFTTCSAEGHMVCFRCVRHSISEAIFGQGWQRSINKDTGTLRCPAISASECQGFISSGLLHQALIDDKNGADILRKLDQRLAEHELVSSGVKLVHCPFCSYAEVDEIYVPPGTRVKSRFNASDIPNLVAVFISMLLLPVLFIIPLFIILCASLYCISGWFRIYVSRQFESALSRYQRRRRGLRFVCQNPECGRASCISCSKAWFDVHVCYESSLVAFRTQVEQAMSMAVKRVCPRCNTSFVKTSGCNKLVCPCGYKMCYVCRKDIASPNEGYQHFCQHFRPEGDGRACGECDKCNLWEAENTEAILREAQAEAERQWRESETRDLSDAEKAYLDKAVGKGGPGNSFASLPVFGILEQLLCRGRWPGMNEISDYVFEMLFV